MEDYYRGDTFVFPFSLQNHNKENINFETGDILKFGAKGSIRKDEYALYKEIEIEEERAEILFEFTPEETQVLNTGNYIIELELTRGDYVDTIYQNQILVKGDVVRNVSKTNSNT